MGKIIECKYIASKIKEEAREKYNGSRLCVITCGDDPASKIYVGNKEKACAECGIYFKHVTIEKSTTVDQLYITLDALKLQKFAVIIQLPFPNDASINSNDIFNMFRNHSDIDADGFSVVHNNLYMNANDPTQIHPCTAQGIVDIIKFVYSNPDKYGCGTSYVGKNVLVLGRSNIVGKPVAQLLLSMDMNVTVCHSKSAKSDVDAYVKNADIVISATGHTDTLTDDDFGQSVTDGKPKICDIIIDVGMNRDTNNHLCGDISEDVKERHAKAYSPVPGGVGPMTVAELMMNVSRLCKWNEKINRSKLMMKSTYGMSGYNTFDIADKNL